MQQRTATTMLGDIHLVPNEDDHSAHKPGNMERGQVSLLMYM